MKEYTTKELNDILLDIELLCIEQQKRYIRPEHILIQYTDEDDVILLASTYNFIVTYTIEGGRPENHYEICVKG